MGLFAEYDRYDALGLADLVRRGEVTSTELLDTALDRVATLNPEVNAVVNIIEANARRHIEAGLSGPLAGVPFLVKDSGIQIKGEQTSNGSHYWHDHIAAADSTVTSRYRAAGLVPFGFTNTAENGLACETAPAAHGATRNPWDQSRSSGGSSGGSGAAVAAGFVPAAHATDGGGSIRVPSSCNGLFGLKPSRGLSPFGPDIGEGWNGLSVHHAITRSVRDSAALLDAIQGPEPGDPYWAPPAPKSFLESLDTPLAPLRVAVQTVTHAGEDVEPIVADATENAAALVESLGHEVEVARPDIDAGALKHATFVIVASNTANVLRSRSNLVGRQAVDEVESITSLWGAAGDRFTGRELAWAIGVIHNVSRQFGRFFQNHDVLITPTCAGPPLPLGTIDMGSTDLDTFYDELYGYNAFLSIYNCAGIPAASVPLVWHDGLPIGVQLAGRLGADDILLKLSAQLEQARPWAHRRPSV